MQGWALRPAPGSLPPGGSRHHKKDSLKEGPLDGWVRWGLDGGSSTFLSLSTPQAHPTTSLGYELPRWV